MDNAVIYYRQLKFVYFGSVCRCCGGESDAEEGIWGCRDKES